MLGSFQGCWSPSSKDGRPISDREIREVNLHAGTSGAGNSWGVAPGCARECAPKIRIQVWLARFLTGSGASADCSLLSLRPAESPAGGFHYFLSSSAEDTSHGRRLF